MRRRGSWMWLGGVLATLITLAVAEPAAAAGIMIREHGPRTRPVVALTIDDGWNPTACRAVFEILERRHVPATFFPVAQAMSADPKLWREIAARGYPIGDHTARHTHLIGKSIAEQLAAITAGRAWARHITGVATIRVLRPPAAEWDAATITAASRAGERLVLFWDTSFADTGRHPSEDALIRHATRGKDGAVILMHCNRMISANVLERVIDAYQARGFTFVTVPQLFGLKGPVPKYAPHPTPAHALAANLLRARIARLAWSLT